MTDFPSKCTRTKSRGFALTEIVVSIGLLAVVGLTIIALFSYLAVSSHTSAERAGASLLADSVLEKAVKAGPGNDWAVGSGNLFTDLETSDAASSTRFIYQVSAQRLRAAPLGDTYQVTVNVSWHSGKRVEEGTGQLQRTRTVYIERSGLSP